VPGAFANYGYSETSAPTCYNGTLIVGAAGSDYGVRGFTMAYHANDLTPAWPTPFWIIPPAGTEWRSAARIVGGCTNWTPDPVDSIASVEGGWFAYDAKTGQPIWQRGKVIDNVEHPDLQPGKTVAVYPSSLGGLNYSPASFDPQTGYVYNAAAETAVAMQQQT